MTPTPEQIEQARDAYRRAVEHLAALGVPDGTPVHLVAESRPRRRNKRARRSGGSLYLRGGVWWVKYYVNGKPMRESARSPKREAAETLLDTRRGQRAKGEPISPKAAKLTVGELLDNLQRRYKINGHAPQAANIARLRRAFGPQRAAGVTGADWNVYLDRHRRTPERPAGLYNATLNRDGAILKRAYSMAREDVAGFTARLEFSRLTEGPPRAGFFEPEQCAAVVRHLPAALRPVAEFGYLTGWRKTEVLGLTWARVSFPEGEVRLDPGTTKNKEGRVFPFTAELRALLEAQRAVTEAVQRSTGAIVPWVFHRRGKPIKEFRKAWGLACKRAGVPGRLFHDFRRSAVRRFEQAGIPRGVAMKLTGHKTEAVYRRYAIVSDKDLRAAALTLSGGLGTIPGHSPVTPLRAREGQAR
jgi:integrase